MSALIRPSATLDSMLRQLGIKRRKLGLGNILIALPLIHIAIATLFLFGYCAGFGGHLARFVRPEDIFSISISEIVKTYMVIAGQLVVFGFLNRKDSDAKTRVEMYGPPPRYHFPYWLRQIASILVVGTMILALVGFFIGESVNPTFVGIVVALQIIVQANRTEAGQRDLVIKMLAFTALVPVLMGAGYGQDDRHNHRQNNGALLKCDAHPVYRPIGGMLLGRLGKSHVLLNEECKPVLTIPDIQPKVPREKVEAVQADLRSHVAALFRFPANRPAPQSPPSARLPSPG